MAKKTKDATVTTKKTTTTGPPDPNKTKNLLRLLNTLAVLLSILAFLLQLFAVLSHLWKWQTTDLHALLSPTYHYAQQNLFQDSRVDQKYGLYTRDVKVYGNNDEQLDVLTSTRFPRIDDDDSDEANYHQCLSQSTTLRGALLTCSNRVNSLEQCHCRRYAYWNWVIFFELAALVLLGIVVFLTALLGTQFQALIKPIAAVLALLAFIFLLVGLILICTHLKRETRSLADAYPHIHQRISNQLGIDSYQRRNPTVLRRAVRQTNLDHYKMYNLLPGQHPYNATHYQEYSTQDNDWVYRPYTSRVQQQGYVYPQPLQQNSQQQRPYVPAQRRTTTAAAVLQNRYGPTLGYDAVYDNTRAGLGRSTIFSILAMIPALLLPLLLIFSLLTGKKAQPETKKDYVAVSQQEVSVQPVPPRQIPTDYNPSRPIGDAFVTTQHVPPHLASTQTTVSTQPTPSRQIPTDYNPNRPTGDVYVTTHHPPSHFGQQSGSPQQGPGRQIPVDYNLNRPTGGDTYINTYSSPGARGPVTQTSDRPTADVNVTHTVRQGPYDNQGGPSESYVVHDVIIPSDSRA